MKAEFHEPPRIFVVGVGDQIELKDCGSIRLEPGEQITFTTGQGAEYDVTRKEWGFYATPSLNGRLSSFGLRGVLVRSSIGRYFVLLVEKGFEKSFEEYRSGEGLAVVAWFDDEVELARLHSALS